MAAAFLATDEVPELLEGLPLWILENQQIGWSGAWEETPTSETRSWADSLIEERAPPYEVLQLGQQKCRKITATKLKDVHFTSADLKVLVYPDGEEISCLYGPKVDSTTDCDGWIYATKPNRLDSQRLGGRATPRFGDRVRRRRWRRGEPLRSESAARIFWCDNSSSAMQSLWNAVGDLAGRRSMSQVPIDPTAVIRRSHSDVEKYQNLCQRLSPWDDLPTLTDMVLAAVYSRAAYAYTGRRGLFDSVTQGAMVFSLHRAAFDYAEHVDDASNEAAFLDMMCLAPEDLLCAQWRSLGPAFAVARDHTLKWIVVAVRGTLSLKDILTDCAVNSVPFLEGTAHEGFVKTSQKLLEEIEELLRKEMQAHQGYRLVFCGHSMGGAVSAMCVAMLRDKAAKDVARYGNWASQCCAYGIGTPAVLSRNICERLAQSRAAFVAVNAQDWSPRASVSSVSELLDDLVELSLARTMMRMATGAGQEPRRPEPEQLEQLPPGVMLQIVPGQDQSLLKASAADYRHSMPAWPDVAAHIPLAYVEGLAAGLARCLRSEGSAKWPKMDAADAQEVQNGQVAQDGQAVAGKAEVDLEMSQSDVTEDLEKPSEEQPPVRLMLLVMLSMFQGYASMVGPLQSAYKHRLGISTDGTSAAHAFTQAAVAVHYGKLIARLGHNVVFARLSPWTRVVIAMCFMFVGITIPTLLVFTLGWSWVGSVFIAYMLSGLGLGIFEVTFLSVITPMGRATKAWAIVGAPAGFATINILGLTASSFGLEMVYIYWYILFCLPLGLFLFTRLAPRGNTELKTANFAASLLQARHWMPGMVPFFVAQFLSHFAMENWPAIFYMFHPPYVPLFNPKSDQHLMKWGQFFAVTYFFIFLGDSISRRIAIYLSTPSLYRRLVFLGLAMACIALGLYLESLAIAIIIPIAIFLVFWGNGTIYGLTAHHVDKHVPSEHNLASYSFWCFVGDLGAVLGGILVDSTHDLFCRGHLPTLAALRRMMQGEREPAATAKLPSFPDKAREVLCAELRMLCSERSRSPRKVGEHAGAKGKTTSPAIEQAKLEALEKLRKLQSVEPKEARAKEWRALLRDWHPDKNPDNIEVAKEVFQFLQKGKTIINV
ncbi:unnamed protein product [Symbiodinium sp. CCMP2456]|nr:unnamed protein product [Symbiodinium sp. CCMP2456]